jgi:hypothetical protein
VVSEQVGEGVGLWHGVLPHGNSTRASKIHWSRSVHCRGLF